MSGPRAPALPISPLQQDILRQIRQRQTACQRLVRRALILLALAANPCVEAVARQLRLTRTTVRLWRDRWQEAAPALLRAEQDDAATPQLPAMVEAVLDDDDRPGTPATFTPEQIVQIVALACEPPEKSGRPLSHWTAHELADEAKKRKIVADISPTTVGRFLKTGRFTAAQEPLLAEQQPRRPRGIRPASRGGL